MLFITDAPLHFGLVALICILTLIGVVITLLGALTAKKARLYRWLEFLFGLFVLLAFLVLAISMYSLPATANVVLLLPYYQMAWAFVGLHGFFLLIYFLWSYIKERIWIAIFPVLGTLSYLILLWRFVTPATTFVISDGVLGYVVMPIIFVGYAGVLAVFYMFLFPFWGMYTLLKKREGPARTWTLITWFGLLLWFISAILMALVQFTVLYMTYIFGLVIISWVITLIGYLMISRSLRIRS